MTSFGDAGGTPSVHTTRLMPVMDSQEIKEPTMCAIGKVCTEKLCKRENVAAKEHKSAHSFCCQGVQ